jgi:hypothetical protein
MMSVITFVPYAALFLVVLSFVFGAAHRLLEFGVGISRAAAVSWALVVGVAAGALACWLSWPDPATLSECVDFTADPSGRC